MSKNFSIKEAIHVGFHKVYANVWSFVSLTFLFIVLISLGADQVVGSILNLSLSLVGIPQTPLGVSQKSLAFYL